MAKVHSYEYFSSWISLQGNKSFRRSPHKTSMTFKAIIVTFLLQPSDGQLNQDSVVKANHIRALSWWVLNEQSRLDLKFGPIWITAVGGKKRPWAFQSGVHKVINGNKDIYLTCPVMSSPECLSVRTGWHRGSQRNPNLHQCSDSFC